MSTFGLLRSSSTNAVAAAAILLAWCGGSLGPCEAHGLPDSDDLTMQIELYSAQLARAQADAAAVGLSGGVIEASQSVYDKFLLWDQASDHHAATACFWNGSDQLRQAVIESDGAWEGFANLTIRYRNAAGDVNTCQSADSADIRISLDGGDTRLDYSPNGRPAYGYWSYIGRAANFTPPAAAQGARYKVTVNLPTAGNLVAMGDWDQFNDLVRHELGHARGLLHEHQRQECAGWFDIKKIAQSQNWTEEYAAQAVASFDQLVVPAARQLTYAGPYDVLSIMQYNFQSSWYKERPGEVNPCKRSVDVNTPSDGDKATLIAMYGASAVVVTAALRSQNALSLDQTVTGFNAAVKTEEVKLTLGASNFAAIARVVPGEGTLPASSPVQPKPSPRLDALRQLEAATENLLKLKRP